MHSIILAKYEDWVSNSLNPENTIGNYSKIFLSHQGRKSLKWNHYLPVYDDIVNYLIIRFGESIRILEIGVLNGGSIEIWRKLFGAKADIWGIDIDPKCAEMGLDANIKIGSSADRNFLKFISDEAQYFNLIIDDGSHHSKHQQIAFESLFPYLSDDGYYIIEDTEHSYYWRQSGGYLRPSSIIQISKRLIDHINGDFFMFPKLRTFKIETQSVHSLTFLQGMIIINKNKKIQPNQVWSGPGTNS